MQRVPVESSNLMSVGFDAKTKTLEIEFHGGGVFQYTGKDAEAQHKGLMASESKGKYFNANIRKNPDLTAVKVSGAPTQTV